MKKFQIFISSTYEDLRAEREQVAKAVLEMGHFPVGMEMFNAANEDQWQIICEHIDKSDYYILISAYRYGSTKNNISFTEREYDYAIARGIPILSFILHRDASWPTSLMDRDASTVTRLDQFHTKVKRRYTNFWFNSADLHAKVLITLANTIISHPRPGWIRVNDSDAARHSQDITQLAAKKTILREELEKLDESLQTTHMELETGRKQLDDLKIEFQNLSAAERRKIYEAEKARIRENEAAREQHKRDDDRDTTMWTLALG